MAVIETIKGVAVDADTLRGKGYLTNTTMSDATVLPYFMAVARAYYQASGDARDAAATMLSGTSATSVTIGAGTKSFTASTGKSWQAGTTLAIFSSATPTNAMGGRVTSYNSDTGALVVDVPSGSFSGSGTAADWVLVPGGIIGPAGIQGPTGPQGIQGIQGITGSGSSIHASQAGVGITAAPRSRINIVSGATVADNPGSDRIDITVAGSSIDASKDGTGVTAAPRSRFNFIGPSITVADNSGANRVDITIPAAPVNRGVIAGLVLSNNVTDATNDIDFTTGVCRSDDNTTDITLASALTKQLDAAWVAGTNQGMLDTGAISNATWHLFAILNPTSGVVDVLASLSPTAPTLPSGYTKQRRIGSILRVSAAIIPFTQRGNDFLRVNPIQDINAKYAGSSAILRTLSVPTGINLIALIRAQTNNGDALLLGAPEETLPVATTSNASLASPAALDYAAGHFAIWTNTSAQINSRLSSGEVLNFLRIHTFGWTDFRGEFA